MTAVWELREKPGHFGAGRKSSRIFLEQNIWLYSGYKSNGSQNLKKTFEPLWKRTNICFLKNIYFFVLLCLAVFKKPSSPYVFLSFVICVSTWQYKEDRTSSKEYSIISGYLWNAGSYYSLSCLQHLNFPLLHYKAKVPKMHRAHGFSWQPGTCSNMLAKVVGSWCASQPAVLKWWLVTVILSTIG